MASYLSNSSQTTQEGLDWTDECFFGGDMLISRRVSRDPRNRQTGPLTHGTTAVAEPASWTVSLECKVDADTRKVFDALTLPEYMEAWICVPGYPTGCGHVKSDAGRGFEIEYRCNSGSCMKIMGRYCTFLKRKLSFSWKPGNGPDSLESFVDIRLHGDFERSILRLRHFGLETENDFIWHSALWSGSIERLCRLFEKPTADGKKQPRAGRRFVRAQSTDCL